MNFFCGAYLIENRASKNYNYFLELIYYYQKISEGGGDSLVSILALPFPLFQDYTTYEAKMKKKEIERKNMKNQQLITNTIGNIPRRM
jgi:hypothetical protein